MDTAVYQLCTFNTLACIVTPIVHLKKNHITADERATYQFKYNMHIITGGEEFRNRTNNVGANEYEVKF